MRQEIRQDPISGQSVIIAPARALRPRDFAEAPQAAMPELRRDCPFCEGFERETPGEVLARRNAGTLPDTPGWQVRVVPNKFPALGGPDASGPGVHEVIVETPRHVAPLTCFADHELATVFEVYAQRLAVLSQDPELAYGLLFKNFGPSAGASLEHAHSQLLALPMVPPLAAAEWSGALDWHTREGGCYWCQLLDRELAERVRVVEESPQFVALTPFASRFAFEVCIVPRRHVAHFHAANPEELGEVASMAKRVIARLERVLEPLAFNYFVHTSPFAKQQNRRDGYDLEVPSHYHWHLEIVPRISNVAGFEWGSGCFINAVPPEVAAAMLRDV